MGCSAGRQPPTPPALHLDLEPGGADDNERDSLPGDEADEPKQSGVNGGAGAQAGEGEERGGGKGELPGSVPTLERLAQATGGTEKSWYRCVFPFGVISLVIGAAGTGVTFTFDTLSQTKVVSVALLCVGASMLFTAVVCWRAHRLRRRKKKEGGFFCSEQGTL